MLLIMRNHDVVWLFGKHLFHQTVAEWLICHICWLHGNGIMLKFSVTKQMCPDAKLVTVSNLTSRGVGRRHYSFQLGRIFLLVLHVM